MRKLMLMSILFATVIIPMLAARNPNARRGVRNTIVLMSVFIALWAMALSHFFFLFPAAE